MKYIIDVPDEQRHVYDEEDMVLSFLVINKNSKCNMAIDTEAMPYTEPDRKAIEDEVWEFVCKFVWAIDDEKILGTDILHAVRDMSYQEAKSKYEARKKKQEEEIRVGDEVIYDSRTKAVVLIPETKEKYGTILTEDFCEIVCSHDELEKTGRHFDEVEELLKKMKEEDK